MIEVGARDMSATAGPTVMSQTLAHESATRSIAEAIPSICRRIRDRSGQPDAEQALELGQRSLCAAVEDRRHAHRLGALAVLAQVVHEDTLLRRNAESLGAEVEDLRLGLVHADLARDHDRVEQLGDQVVVVGGPSPRVRDETGRDAACAYPPHGLDHRGVRLHPGEEPLDHARALRDAEEGREAILELGHLELAALELPQQVESLAALPEQLPHGLRLAPLALAERAERLEDVRRQHAAAVGEPPPPVRAAG